MGQRGFEPAGHSLSVDPKESAGERKAMELTVQIPDDLAGRMGDG